MRLLAIVLFCLTSLGTYAQPPQSPNLQEQLHAVAGMAAKDCGSVAVRDTPEPASECAAEAFKRRLPFYLVYYVRGIDSVVGRALAENERGDVFELRFDLDPSGGSHSPESIEVNQCSNPVRLVMSRTGRLKCGNARYAWDVGFCGPTPREVSASSFSKYKGSIRANLVIHADDGTASVDGISKRDVPLDIAEAALQDVPRWRFYPASKDGTPVSVRFEVEMRSDGNREQVSFPSATKTNCFDSESVITRP